MEHTRKDNQNIQVPSIQPEYVLPKNETRQHIEVPFSAQSSIS